MTKRQAGTLSLPLFILGLWVGCAGDGPDVVETAPEPVPGATIDFDSDVQPLFDEHCSCHLSVSAPQGLVLREGASFDLLVNVPSVENPDLLRVKPGAPDESYLLIKVDDSVPGVSSLRSGDRMPPQLPPMPRSQLQVLRRWIAEGAVRDAPQMDAEAPQFGGLSEAVAVSSSEVDLFWPLAADNATSPEDIIYDVFLATTSGAQDFSTPSRSAAAGSTALRVGNLEPATSYFFVVRAVDAAGNRDQNLRELEVRTLDPSGTPPTNRPPVADAGGPYAAILGTPLTLSGSGSEDPEGAPLTFSWDFGDGGTGSGESVEHAYEEEGEFTVVLVVDDGELSSQPASTTVTVEGDPFPRAAVVERVCSQCHGLRVRLPDGRVGDITPPGLGLGGGFRPGDFRTATLRSSVSWQSTVSRMRNRNGAQMTDEEERQIVTFLAENYSNDAI